MSESEHAAALAAPVNEGRHTGAFSSRKFRWVRISSQQVRGVWGCNHAKALPGPRPHIDLELASRHPGKWHPDLPEDMTRRDHPKSAPPSHVRLPLDARSPSLTIVRHRAALRMRQWSENE